MMDWMQDQYLIAGLAVFIFSIFCLGFYIVNEERKSRIRIEPTESGDWPL